ncbi:hypothetical protein EMCRGX_G028801 [Ephydatia muelleri]
MCLFRGTRPFPYAMRERVEMELRRLEKEGVLEPIEFSNWAAPIVALLKSDGKVRICGDFRVSVNPALKLDEYPIPKVEDLLATLAGVYEYDIKYKKTSQHGNADGLSRLPLTKPDEEQSEVPTEVVLLVEALTNDLCSDIQRWTKRDPLLSTCKVSQFILHGWQEERNELHGRRAEVILNKTFRVVIA